MSFVAKLQRAREVLEQQGRLSVRALGRELALAGDELELLSQLHRALDVGEPIRSSGTRSSIVSSRSSPTAYIVSRAR